MSDPRADRFRELYAANVHRITGYALRRVASPEDAADVVAETFLVAWRRTLDLPAGEEARLWLYGVARRVLANHRRGVVRRERLGWKLRDQLGRQIHVDDPADELIETRAVRVAMERLGELDREVLRLHVWEQLEPREIAVVLGLRPEAVRTRLSRARVRLRTELLGEDVGDVRAVAGHAPGVRTTYVSEEER
ncbi:MAG: subfamily polymerase sigma-24 subunit [Nocardioidaceae bacterium]|nr:subfamily polymerase sigma-24 subunit [Nocardioidaceae bacterium]